MKNNQSILPQRLKIAREKMGLTQEQVAKQLNIEIGTLSGYELGRRRPNTDILAKIASIYNVSSDYLLGLTNQFNITSKDELLEQFMKMPLSEKKSWLVKFISLIKDEK